MQPGQLAHIPHGDISIEGMLELPENLAGIVLFAHGSGSSRHSPRNNYVARILREAGIGTLLMDLLTPEEDDNYETRFDISLLTWRLLAATAWVNKRIDCQPLPLGYFGASTGAAAALQAAAKLDGKIAAVVSRGGRPDLAGADTLGKVVSPTLLLVGGDDDEVIDLNRRAAASMRCHNELVIIPGATHLFEEPGALESVAHLAATWFERYFK
ncbi:MAG: alpha/beta hydrolase [Pseudomonadota bacterium]